MECGETLRSIASIYGDEVFQFVVRSISQQMLKPIFSQGSDSTIAISKPVCLTICSKSRLPQNGARKAFGALYKSEIEIMAWCVCGGDRDCDWLYF